MMMVNIINYISLLTGAKVGGLPEGAGMVIQLAPSGQGVSYFDGTSSDNVSLLFLSKSNRSQNALSSLVDVCNKITRTKHNNGIYNPVVSTEPNYVGKDGEYWIYSCIINVKYHNKEVYYV